MLRFEGEQSMKAAIIKRPENKLCKGCIHGIRESPVYICLWSTTDGDETGPLDCPLGIPLTHKRQKEVKPIWN